MRSLGKIIKEDKNHELSGPNSSSALVYLYMIHVKSNNGNQKYLYLCNIYTFT